MPRLASPLGQGEEVTATLPWHTRSREADEDGADGVLAVPELMPSAVRAVADVPFEELDERHGRSVRGVDEATLAVLRRYAWPGNVRELRNVLERAVIVCPDDLIRVAHLPSPPAATAPTAEPGADQAAEDVRLRVGTTVDEAERRLILRTLAYTGNNKTRAAEILGISLKTLHNKLNRYNHPP